MKAAQEQNRQETDFGSDLFAEYVNDLPEPEIAVSERVERDIQRYQNQKDEKKQKRFRMITLVIAAAAALVFRAAVALPKTEPDRQAKTQKITQVEPRTQKIHYDAGDGRLDSDLNVPEIQIDGTYYRFPFALSDLLENGWGIEEPFGSMEVGEYNAFINLNKDGKDLYSVPVRSPFDTTAEMKEAAVTGLTVNEHTGPEVVLPGGIQAGQTTEEELIQVMRDSGLSWAYEEFHSDNGVTVKTYTCYAPAENESFTYYQMKFTVMDDGIVDTIGLWLVDFAHPLDLGNAVNT